MTSLFLFAVFVLAPLATVAWLILTPTLSPTPPPAPRDDSAPVSTLPVSPPPPVYTWDDVR